jgi:hypothetical protein
MADDFYVQWYTAKLWQMLPAVYRTLDVTDQLDGAPISPNPGPLQELITRIGTQAALLRRSIDRLWENQSIETCDDWVIPYIGDLLATRVVSCLDARRQRLDVAKTIYYRRRSGTLGLIEELATDIAGHDARAVEFFRRLGRTRHSFDPPIGLVPNLSAFPTKAMLLAGPPPSAVIEGLSGPYSRTPAGGYADLRNAYAASCAGTAFDEFSYTADFRAGRQSIGWQNIPHLGVFVWWLYAFPVSNGTPVQCATNPKCFTFDPTGRTIPLFSPSSRAREDFADNWVAPNEWELATAVRNTLWNLLPNALYSTPQNVGAFDIALGSGQTAVIQTADQFQIDPETGRFWFLGSPPGEPVSVSYSFGFSSAIGAGQNPAALPSIVAPIATVGVSAGTTIDSTLTAVAHDTTLQFSDSTTFTGPTVDPGQNTAPPTNLALVAASGARPVLRWKTPATWTLTGRNGTLVLQGLWLQGADLVIAGTWDQVILQLCTIDPGTADLNKPGASLTAIDGVVLAPSHIFVEGQVNALTLQSCITGPIRTRQGGAIATFSASDSIIQSVPTHAPGAAGALYDPADLAARLLAETKLQPPPPSTDPGQLLLAALGTSGEAAIKAYKPGNPVSGTLLSALQSALAGLNAAQMQTAFPLALADLALGADNGNASLTRTTVLGPIQLHRLSASECILDEVATVDDPQEGCVRFSTLATGNNLHAPYRCAIVLARSSIFQSRQFGMPNYARLRPGADQAILPGSPQQRAPSVSNGAANGAEPGAFAREAQALAQRGLAQKLEEYSPICLTPVWVDADL